MSHWKNCIVLCRYKSILAGVISVILIFRNRNIYRRRFFPYDMRQAVHYAEESGRGGYDLSEEELDLFLLPGYPRRLLKWYRYRRI